MTTNNLYYKGGIQIPQLQILKGICALLVVEIHVPSIRYAIIQYIFRVAVPIFFMITGYFLLEADGSIKPERLKRGIVKLLYIYLPTIFVFMVYDLSRRFLLNDVAGFFPNEIQWCRFALWGWMAGGFRVAHLWYLVACFEALAVIYLLVRYRRLKWLMVLAGLGWVLGLYLRLEAFGVQHLARNFLTVALPSITAGIMIRRYETRIRQSQPYLWWMVALSFLLLQICEFTLIERFTPYWFSSFDMVITTLPLAAALFIAVLCSGNSRWLAPLEYIGRNHSLSIYILHVPIADILVMCVGSIIPVMYFEQELVIIICLLLSITWKYLMRNFDTRKKVYAS